MTPTFSLSWLKALPFDFEKEVAAFVQAKKDHLLTEGSAAPTHHPSVEAAVKRIPGSVQFDDKGKPMPETQTPDDFVADYQIYDDTPPPPTVEQKKTAIAATCSEFAQALLNENIPPLKARIWQMQYADAVQAKAKEQASNEQLTTIADYEARQARAQRIVRHLAEMESQLHDLPEDMIDIWKPEPFPT
jgi:hypothetical protein